MYQAKIIFLNRPFNIDVIGICSTWSMPHVDSWGTAVSETHPMKTEVPPPGWEQKKLSLLLHAHHFDMWRNQSTMQSNSWIVNSFEWEIIRNNSVWIFSSVCLHCRMQNAALLLNREEHLGCHIYSNRSVVLFPPSDVSATCLWQPSVDTFSLFSLVPVKGFDSPITVWVVSSEAAESVSVNVSNSFFGFYFTSFSFTLLTFSTFYGSANKTWPSIFPLSPE